MHDEHFSISAFQHVAWSRRLVSISACQPLHAGVLADRLKSRLAKPGGVLKC
jgi:hypothetical protein